MIGFSARNRSFLLKERRLGFKPKYDICNILNFNFLQYQNSVPTTMGIFSTDKTEFVAESGYLIIINIYKLKEKSHGYNNVYH